MGESALPLILSCYNEQLLFFNRELLRRKIYGGEMQTVETEIKRLETLRSLILEYFKSNKKDGSTTFFVKGIIDISFESSI